MTFYIIDYNRLMLEYNINIKGKADGGTYNWFIDTNNILHIIINTKYGIKYLYTEHTSKINAVIKLMLYKDLAILGLKDDIKVTVNNNITTQEASSFPIQ